jgi:putative NADH-flavin reductase
MKIVLYGATGRAGSRILQELLSRGHDVTGVSRDPGRLLSKQGLTAVKGELSAVPDIVRRIQGADAVVGAYAPPADDTEELASVTMRFIEAVRQAEGVRFLMVGGAGSLLLPDGTQLIDAPFFPEEWKAIAEAHRKSLALLLASDVDWTYLSPAAYFDPGQRTGIFRLGRDELIADEDGQSRISMEDYAIAVADELETPRHRRRRFSIGY